MLSEDSQWTSLLHTLFFSNNGQPITHYFPSSVLLGIKSQNGIVIANSFWIVGTGDKINFWTNNWLGILIVETVQIPSAFHSGLSCSL